MEKIKTKKRIFEYDLICTNFFMICNPLFFMLSGKFNLNKEFNSLEDYKKYYKSKIITIFIPFFIVSIIIYFLNNYNNLSIIDFFEKFTYSSIEGTYWFIYNLIGIIIITPFLSKMIKNMNLLDKKIYFYFVIVITSFITVILALGKKTIINFATFGIISWIFYYLLGYFVEDVFKSSKSRKIIICIGLLAFVLQLIIERFFKSAYRIYDPSPILTLEAVSLYFLILNYIKIKNEGIKKIILLIAKYSYIFYLFHNTIIDYTFKFIKFNLNMSSKMNMVYGVI